jgi:glycosyltransferase involved in cell wall biosynthesis
MKPEISVITPSYNQGRFIERTIQSVLSQGIARLEYVVFDGGSTDETVSILQKYESQLRWVSEKDRGQTHAVNKGLVATCSDIIGWLNSDDVYYQSTLRTVLDYFASHPETDVIYGKAHHISETDEIINEYYTEAWNVERLKEVCFLCQPSVFFRRRMVERFGLLDESLQLCMDYEYWLRLALGGATFAYIPQMLSGSRLYAENKTLRDRVRVSSEINDMVREKIGYVPAQWIYNFAWAKVESSGYHRSDPIGFARALAVEAIRTSLQWNRSISLPVMVRSARWFGGGYWRAIRTKLQSE